MAAPEDIPFDPAALIRVAVVASVDQGAARCTLHYASEDGNDVESPPLPWLVGRQGETGVWTSPSVGEQGVLFCPWGDIAQGIFLPGLTSDQFPPVGNSAEEVIRFADGARLAYDPEGHVLTADLPAGATANITADQLNITGNVAIDGDLSVTGTVTADTDVVGGGKSLKDHKHTGVTAGGGVSGPPQ